MFSVSKENALELLNVHLTNHTNYEDWMKFDDIELVGNKPSFLFRLNPPNGTKLSHLEIRQVYDDTVRDILQPT